MDEFYEFDPAPFTDILLEVSSIFSSLLNLLFSMVAGFIYGVLELIVSWVETNSENIQSYVVPTVGILMAFFLINFGIRGLINSLRQRAYRNDENANS